MLVHFSMKTCRFDSVNEEFSDGALFSTRVSSANAFAAPSDVPKVCAATADDAAIEMAKIPNKISLTFSMVLSIFEIYVILEFLGLVQIFENTLNFFNKFGEVVAVNKEFFPFFAKTYHAKVVEIGVSMLYGAKF